MNEVLTFMFIAFILVKIKIVMNQKISIVLL